MSHLVQIAATQSKPKKAEAAETVRSLASRLGEQDPAYRELAALYNWFLPPAPKGLKAASKDAFTWVATAAGVRDVRFYLNFVYATGTHIVGTDGRRLHLAPDSRPAGFYCPRSGEHVFKLADEYPKGELPAGHPTRYPDFERIIDRGDTSWASDSLENVTAVIVRELSKKDTASQLTVDDKTLDVPTRQWSQAVAGHDDTARVRLIGPQQVQIESDHFGADTVSIIMSLR